MIREALFATTMFVSASVIAFPGGDRMLLSQAPKSIASSPSDLDALIKAARSEGEVTYYMVMAESTTKRINDAFTSKFGIKSQFIRLPTNPLLQRFSTEAEAGTFAADFLIIAGGGRAYAEEAVKKGWLESIVQAGIPAIGSGEFPARFVTGPTAIIQITPHVLAYNSTNVKPEDAPRDWGDLVNVRWKGQVLLPDVKTADTYLDFWSLLLDKYGEQYFTQLRSLNPRAGYASGTALVQGIAAGEGMIAAPSVMPLVLGLRSRGAPILAVTPSFNTGPQQHIVVTPRSKAKHPNAGRLFVHFLLSKEGNKILNDEPGSVGVYDDSALPKEYQSPKPMTATRRELIYRLLGAQ